MYYTLIPFTYFKANGSRDVDQSKWNGCSILLCIQTFWRNKQEGKMSSVCEALYVYSNCLENVVQIT